MSNQTISVVFSGNNKIFNGIVLSALSLLKNTTRPLRIYILTMNLTELDPRFKAISDRQIAALDSVMKGVNPESGAVKLDVTEEFRKELINSKNVKNNFTPYAMLRLLMDTCEVPDKMLYLDADTMCCSDVAQLFDIDIEDYEFAAVKDKVGHVWVRPHYCNSGVLLMNMKKIRETQLLARCRRKVVRRRMFMPDQSALNFLGKKKLYLPYIFNEQRTIKSDTVIKHFCQYFKWFGPFFKLKNVKQWEIDKVHNILNIHDFDDIYGQYAALDQIYRFKED